MWRPVAKGRRGRGGVARSLVSTGQVCGDRAAHPPTPRGAGGPTSRRTRPPHGEGGAHRGNNFPSPARLSEQPAVSVSSPLQPIGRGLSPEWTLRGCLHPGVQDTHN